MSSNDKVLTGFSSSNACSKIKVNIITSFRPFKASQIGWMTCSGFFVIVCWTVFVSLRLVKSEFLTIKPHTISKKIWNKLKLSLSSNYVIIRPLSHATIRASPITTCNIAKFNDDSMMWLVNNVTKTIKCKILPVWRGPQRIKKY